MHLLFLCTGNSCRSQMAEAWARELAQHHVPALSIVTSSAGVEAHGLNPRAVRCMQKHGIDISQQVSKVLTADRLRAADWVVTVCSNADANCPLLGPETRKLHLPFPDPAQAVGDDAQIEACFDLVCLEIKEQVALLLRNLAELQHSAQ